MGIQFERWDIKIIFKMVEDAQAYLGWLQSTKNRLLQKDDIGKAKPCCASLPPPQFSYGRFSGWDREGAGAVMSSWNVHKPQAKRINANKDFKEMNRRSVQAACHTAKHQTSFRKTANVNVQERTGKIVREKIVTEEGFSFGVPTRPSTPIHGVMGNLYGRVSAEVKNHDYTRSCTRPRSMAMSTRLGSPKSTRASALAHSFIKSKNEGQKSATQQFKITKFLKTAPRTNTHRLSSRQNVKAF